MLKVPLALSTPPPGIGVLTWTVEAPAAGHVRLRRARREPRISRRAAGSTASSTMFVPPFSKRASRRLSSRPGTSPAAGGDTTGAGAPGRSGRRRKSARRDSSPSGVRSIWAHGVFTRSRSMARRAGHCRSMPVISARATVSSGRLASWKARLLVATLPRAESEKGSRPTMAVRSASAAPATRPLIGSHDCSVARSAPRSVSAISPRRWAPSIVPRAVRRPRATVAVRSTGEVPRGGQVTSRPVSPTPVISAVPPSAASAMVARPSSIRTLVIRTSGTTVAEAGEAGAAASAGVGGRSRAVRSSVPSAARSIVAAGWVSVSWPSARLAGHVYSRPRADTRVAARSVRVPSPSVTRSTVASPATVRPNARSWVAVTRSSAVPVPATRAVSGRWLASAASSRPRARTRRSARRGVTPTVPVTSTSPPPGTLACMATWAGSFIGCSRSLAVTVRSVKVRGRGGVCVGSSTVRLPPTLA